MSNSSKTTLQSSMRFSHNGEQVRAAKAETGRSYAIGLCCLFLATACSCARVWLDSVLDLEANCGIQSYDEMNSYGVTATHAQLDGEKLHAFKGFFAQNFASTIIIVRRRHARVFLVSQSQVQRGPNVPVPIITTLRTGSYQLTVLIAPASPFSTATSACGGAIKYSTV